MWETFIDRSQLSLTPTLVFDIWNVKAILNVIRLFCDFCEKSKKKIGKKVNRTKKVKK